MLEQLGNTSTDEESRGRSIAEESSRNIELPLLTPATNESSQNGESQVILNPISDESNAITDIPYVQDVHPTSAPSCSDIPYVQDVYPTAAPRCSQRSTKGVPKKQQTNQSLNIMLRVMDGTVAQSGLGMPNA
uniref:Uncharacterized protein n=1 Tax=Populus alba TaxID=43335 RepID=A0A4U5NB60_POPAL|nr:hypothetical protein D5086_0000270460 [Populus alba]